MKRTRLAIAAAIGALALASTAQAASHTMISSNDPQGIVDAMRAAGYSATLTTDKSGDPKIKGKLSKSEYSIVFYSCQKAKDCLSIQFSAGYDLNKGLTDSKANEWNYGKRWAKMSLDDEGDPYLQMDVNLRYGVTEETFADTLDVWRMMLEDFEPFIGWN